MTDSSNVLWATYAERRDLATRNALVERYLPLVRRVAMQVRADLPRQVELDDLISYGSVGLIDAVERFEPKRGARFTVFAWSRIKGAILDDLRRSDVVRRNVRDESRIVNRAQAELTRRFQREPTWDEVASELGVSRDRLEEMRSTAYSTVHPLSIDVDEGNGPRLDEVLPGSEGTPDQEYDITELREKVAAAWNALPTRERTVLHLRYVEGLTYAEAAEALGGIASSRVNQVVTEGIRALRLEIAVL